MGPVALSVVSVPFVAMLFSWSPLGFVLLTLLIILVLREQPPFVLPLSFMKHHWGKARCSPQPSYCLWGLLCPFRDVEVGWEPRRSCPREFVEDAATGRRRREGRDKRLPGSIWRTRKACTSTVVLWRAPGLRMVWALIIKLGSWIFTHKGLLQRDENS